MVSNLGRDREELGKNQIVKIDKSPAVQASGDTIAVLL